MTSDGKAAGRPQRSEAWAPDDLRVAQLEGWVFEQGRVPVYDDCHHPAGWMVFAMPATLDHSTMNPPIGVGATKIDALEALCVVLTGEPSLPPW